MAADSAPVMLTFCESDVSFRRLTALMEIGVTERIAIFEMLNYRGNIGKNAIVGLVI